MTLPPRKYTSVSFDACPPSLPMHATQNLNLNFLLPWIIEKFNDACDNWHSVISWILNTDIRTGLFIVFVVDYIGVKGLNLRREVYSTAFVWPCSDHFVQFWAQYGIVPTNLSSVKTSQFRMCTCTHKEN